MTFRESAIRIALPAARDGGSIEQEASEKPTDTARLQTYLRKLLGNERIFIDTPKKAGASVEMRVGDEFVGTVHRDDDEGEVSFSLQVVILDEDLPPVAKPR